MPHARPRQHPLDPVRLELPVYIRDGPLQVVHYPCPCGNAQCVQPVLVNNHHMQALHNAQQRVRNIDGVAANLADPHHNPVDVNPNRNGPVGFLLDREPLRLQYPMYPEDRPRDTRRSTRRRSKRNRSQLEMDSDNECDLDR